MPISISSNGVSVVTNNKILANSFHSKCNRRESLGYKDGFRGWGSGFIYTWQPRSFSTRGMVPNNLSYPTRAEGLAEVDRIISLKPEVIHILPFMRTPLGGTKQILDPNNSFNYVFDPGGQHVGSCFSMATVWDVEEEIKWIYEAAQKIKDSGIEIMIDYSIYLSPDADMNEKEMIDYDDIPCVPNDPDNKWWDIRYKLLNDEKIQNFDLEAFKKRIRDLRATWIRLDAAHEFKKKFPKYFERFISEIKREFPGIKIAGELLGDPDMPINCRAFYDEGFLVFGNSIWEFQDCERKRMEAYLSADPQFDYLYGRKFNNIEMITSHDMINKKIRASNDGDPLTYSNIFLFMLGLAKQGYWGYCQGFESVDKEEKSNVFKLNTYNFNWGGAQDLMFKTGRINSFREHFPHFNYGEVIFYPSLGDNEITCFSRRINGLSDVFCVVNLAHSDQIIDVPLEPGEKLVEIDLNRNGFPKINEETFEGFARIGVGRPTNSLNRSNGYPGARAFWVFKD